MPFSGRRVRLLIIVAVCCCQSTVALEGRAGEPCDLVTIQSGDLPIILSAPHGGQRDVRGAAIRTGAERSDGSGSFVVSRDTGTEEVALALASRLETRLKLKPFLVVSRAHRKYVDPNRPATGAFESSEAEQVYRQYHDALESHCREVRNRFRGGLLIDLHGQRTFKDAIVRGTVNGKTVTLLRELCGEAAHVGPRSLSGQLRAAGWKVLPDPLDGPEPPAYVGGHIVRTYGSHQGFGIDAIQLELGSDLRTADARDQTVTGLADAVVSWATDFLLADQQPADASKVGESLKKPAVRVAVYRGPGASRSRGDLVRILQQAEGIEVDDISPEEIRLGLLKNYQVVVHPGGTGGGQGKALDAKGREREREFIAGGGGFLGVCAGAYLATSDYDWSLHVLDARVVDRQHWNRGFGTVEIGLSPLGKDLLHVSRDRLPIYYHQGPLLAPAGRDDLPDFESLASFKSEIARNGAPAGVMIDQTAVAAGRYQAGRVLCFSPHPELTDGQGDLLVRAVAWLSDSSSVAVKK